MINDISTFLEIVSQNHQYRPENKKLPAEDVKEIEDLIGQLEKFVDEIIDGPSKKGEEKYSNINLLSDRVKNFLICLLLDEIHFWRSEDKKQ